MRLLIALNFALGFLFCGALVLGAKSELLDSFGILLWLAFVCLFFVNLGFIFLSWKKRHFYSLAPAATYIIAFTLFNGLARAGTNYMLKGTLYRPDSFFDETRKKEFTEIATRVLKAKKENILRPDTYAGLKKYDMKLLFLDTNEQLVEFGQFHSHVWFEYIYSQNGITNLPYVDEHPIQSNLGDGWYFRNW